MSELKKMWGETCKELDSAFCSLGRSIVKSAKLGIKTVNEWANSDDGAEKTDKTASNSDKQ